MATDPFKLPGTDLLRIGDKFTLGGNKGGSQSPAPAPVKNKSLGQGGGGRRKAAPDPECSDLEAMDMTPVGEPVEEKPKEPEAVLSEGAWVKAETLFHEEADVTVKLKLPPGKEHITRVEVEVHAKRSSGPELIAKGEGHAAADGTATVTIPIYKPKNHDGGIAEYYVTFKHKLAKALEPESLLRKIQETAMKSADHELVPGIVFGTNSSFIRPKVADGLKALETKVKEWEKKHPKGKIVLYGHANADEKDGKALSERRAQSAYAFITNDAATWEKLYTTEKWGLWALQHLLLDLGHYHGKPDNMDGPGTQGAFKAFQKKSGLPETGKEDSATRKALFGAYMKGKHDIKIDAGRFRKVAGNEWMGCSANNRAKEGDAPAPENRRVAFILIEESKFFPIHFPCQDGNEAGCQGQCKKAGKRSAPGIKCSFYDELVREVKQPEVKEEEKEEAETSEIPWITIAEREAKKWKGIKEEEISKTINFHKEVGINLSDLVGTDHAWCASFVNYCLKEAGFAMSSPPCRARSFLTDENFTKIDKPIFGAIAVIGTHHVCFAYADDKKSAKPVMLGGNQSDQINFTVFHESITYLVPKLFDPSKNTIPALAEKTSAELNSEFGIVHSKKTGDATR